MRSTAILASVLILAGGAARAAEPAAGRLVAQRSCGGCHAVADGPSPLAAAPPFRTLYLRYGDGGLGALLDRGMLADHPRPLEEGSRSPNGIMPQVALETDEVAADRLSAQPRAPDRRGASSPLTFE